MKSPFRSLAVVSMAALTGLLVIGGLSCPPPPNPACKDAASLIGDGKNELALGTDLGYTEAQGDFDKAVQKGCGSNADEARFGYVVASILHQATVITTNIKTLLALAQGLPGAAPPELARQLRAAQASGGINVFIDTLVQNYIASVTGDLEAKLQQVMKNQNFSFRIQSLPISIDLSAVGLGNQKIGDLGGNYTLTEVNVLYALLRALDGMGSMVESIDFNLNVGDVLAGFSQGVFKISFSLSNPQEALNDVLGILAFLLNTSNNFLGLRPQTGQAATQSAATAFSDSFGGLVTGLQFAEKRFTSGAQQSDDVMQYSYDSGKQTEQLTINLKGISSTTCSQAGFNLNALVIPLGTKKAGQTGVVGALQDLQKSFVTPGFRASWASDIAPLTAIAAYAFIRSTLFDKVLSLAASGVDPKTLSLITSFICTSYFTPSLIEALIETVIPDVIQFDFGTAFQTPKGLRTMLPVWSCPNCSLGNFSQQPSNAAGTLLLQYECAPQDLDPKYFGFACAATAPSLADSDHFVAPPTFAPSIICVDAAGTPCPSHNFYITADGVASVTPYLPIIDPTFSGALYVNLSNFSDVLSPPSACAVTPSCAKLIDGTNDVGGFQLADSKGFNTAIMLVAKSIFSLLATQGAVAVTPQH